MRPRKQGLAHARFSVKFYVVALLFVLFDIEVIFLVPWTLVYREFLAHRSPSCFRFSSSWACSHSVSFMKSKRAPWTGEIGSRSAAARPAVLIFHMRIEKFISRHRIIDLASSDLKGALAELLAPRPAVFPT